MEAGTPSVGSLDEVYQNDDDAPHFPIAAVRVVVDGPVQSQAMPTVSGGSRSLLLSSADGPKRIGNEDPRRKQLTILSDQPFYVGEDQNQVMSRYGARWPANTPLNITHGEAVYVGVVPNAMTLKEVTATGDVVAGPVTVRSITLSSVNGAASGAGKLEVRDGAAGAVLLTLRVLQDTSVSWEAADTGGVVFTAGPHATISGVGPGILATFEYETTSTTVRANVSVLTENWAS